MVYSQIYLFPSINVTYVFLAIDNKFLLSIAYHSSRSGSVAESIIFPWGWKEKGQSEDDRKTSPDYS